MRRRGTPNAPPYPPSQVGPSKHGKSLAATHLTLFKERVREIDRQKSTGISCLPRPSQAGTTSGWQMYPRVAS